jgi:hypothetical protein
MLLDINKFFETLAKIIGQREGVKIKVVSIKKKAA